MKHMTPEELKKIKEEALSNPFVPITDIYDAPLSAQVDSMNRMIYQSFEDQCMRVVYNMGININKDGLVKALNADRERYEQAYCEGWAACKKVYEEKLRQISKLCSAMPYGSSDRGEEEKE